MNSKCFVIGVFLDNHLVSHIRLTLSVEEWPELKNCGQSQKMNLLLVINMSLVASDISSLLLQTFWCGLALFHLRSTGRQGLWSSSWHHFRPCLPLFAFFAWCLPFLSLSQSLCMVDLLKKNKKKWQERTTLDLKFQSKVCTNFLWWNMASAFSSLFCHLLLHLSLPNIWTKCSTVKLIL